MGWWSRRSDPDLLAVMLAIKQSLEQQSGSGESALARALEGFASKAIESQGKNLEAIANVAERLSELSVRRAAQALGSRGGKRSAEKKKQVKAASTCIICAGGRGTSAEIVKHVQESHEAVLLEAARSVSRAANGGANGPG